MRYSPRPFPANASSDELARFFYEELMQLVEALETAESVTLVRRHAAPDKVEDGQLELADGSDWNPGSGAGVYYWDEVGDAWVFLG